MSNDRTFLSIIEQAGKRRDMLSVSSLSDDDIRMSLWPCSPVHRGTGEIRFIFKEQGAQLRLQGKRAFISAKEAAIVSEGTRPQNLTAMPSCVDSCPGLVPDSLRGQEGEDESKLEKQAVFENVPDHSQYVAGLRRHTRSSSPL